MTKENVKKTENSENENKEVFPGGPTEDMVANWKKKYGEVYMTEFDFDVFIWRTLGRLEYKKLLSENEGDIDMQWFREEKITEICTLWPKDFSHDDVVGGRAGTPRLLSEQILNKSGFTSNGGAIRL
jgi:hypothetical protein